MNHEKREGTKPLIGFVFFVTIVTFVVNNSLEDEWHRRNN